MDVVRAAACDGQAAEQRVGKFFQHEKPQQRKLNKSGVFIGFEF
jgi:hypothetical protein